MYLIFWASLSGKFWFSTVKEKTHILTIQSSLSYFNLWLRRLLEIGFNALTPACHCALTGVSSSISRDWSWRRHPWWGVTLLHCCVSCQTHLWNLSTSSLPCVLYHFLALKGFMLSPVFCHFLPHFFQQEWAVVTTKRSIFTSMWLKKIVFGAVWIKKTWFLMNPHFCWVHFINLELKA